MLTPDLTYVPLHVHSCYSIEDGLQNVGPIVKYAANMGAPGVAITDWNNMAGYVRFYNACIGANIKPIMGADVQVRENHKAGEEPRSFIVTLLAMDWTGRQNLYDILSDGWLHSNATSVSWVNVTVDDLAKYSKGIILLNGFRADLAYFNSINDHERLNERIAFYQKYYKDRFCLELTRTGRDGEAEFERLALRLCQEKGFFPVATNDTRFLNGPTGDENTFSDYYVHDVRVSIQRGIPRGSKELAHEYSEQQYMRTPEEMAELFSDIPEAIYNTRIIAERCNATIELDHPRLPHFDTGDMNAGDFLRKEAREGLKKRLEFLYPDPDEREKQRPRYEERLETELDVIIKMDFPGYFLIVMEFIKWSKRHNVPVGPGRGSGGGSLVAYAIEITDFDPLRFDLLFERFLNPERVSMPDFDVDFCQRNRHFTLEFVKEHYDKISLARYGKGKIAVSQIAAYGTLAAKAALKAAGKALGMSYGSVDLVAKMIPNTPGMTFELALGLGKNKDGSPMEPAAPDFYNYYQDAKNHQEQDKLNLINIAMRLEGVIRSIGKHAAGVVISPTYLTEFAPLMLDADGNPITQYDKKDVEHAGLVKFDFLGLTTLTIIDDALKMINRKRKAKGLPDITAEQIPYYDEAAFNTIQKGETTAVFQLESTGMRKLITQMKPDRFDDLVALVALYRPGPLQSGMVDHFVKRKHGEEQVCYPQPDFQDMDLKPILDSTYGVIVYQEQVMQIAQVLAGYSLGGADLLRRAMGKKIASEMAAQRSIFAEGAKSLGKDPDICMKIFDQVEQFAKYGFNKSHSAAYALVAWWTLWLKQHYPAEFLAAMMTADCLKKEKLISYIDECARLGIKVNAPHVNEGYFNFNVNDKGEVIFGFSALKGIGEELSNQIVKERENNGKFKNLFDFTKRVFADKSGKRLLSSGSLEALIESGALDGLGPNRASMIATSEKALQCATQNYNDKSCGQLDIFAAFEDNSLNTPEFCFKNEWSTNHKLQLEKAIVGLYMSGHPIEPFKNEIMHYCNGVSIGSMQPGSFDRPAYIRIAGMVTASSKRISKKTNKEFYIITIDDGRDSKELALFDKNAANYRNVEEAHNHGGDSDAGEFKTPLILVVDLRYSLTEEGAEKINVVSMRSLEDLRIRDASNITLNITKKVFDEKAEQINSALMRNRISREELDALSRDAMLDHSPIKGCSVNIIIGNTQLKPSDKKYLIKPTNDLIDSMMEIAGSKSIRINY